MSEESIKARVIERYGDVATRVREKQTGSCCGPSVRDEASCDTISGNLYRLSELKGIPEEAVQASLGCGNPVMLASSSRARSCWISAQVAGSMCCSRRSVLARQGRPTAST